MARWPDDRDRCRQNGWGVGTYLAGSEGYGMAVIRIDAISPDGIRATQVQQSGFPVTPQRSLNWVLWCRDWQEIDPEALPIISYKKQQPKENNMHTISFDQIAIGDVVQKVGTSWPGTWYTVTHKGTSRLIVLNQALNDVEGTLTDDGGLWRRNVPADPCSMSTKPEAYTPKVGDRVRRAVWSAEDYVDVTYVGKQVFVGTTKGGSEVSYSHTESMSPGYRWVKVPKPIELKGSWVTAYDKSVRSVGGTYATLRDAYDNCAKTRESATIIHIKPDATTEVVWRHGDPKPC